MTASVDELVQVAISGLTRMYLPDTREFVQTVRPVPEANGGGPALRTEGTNLRYAAIVALGLRHVGAAGQRHVLAGGTARHLTAAVCERARTHPDPGAVALAAWAAAEVDQRFDAALFARLASTLSGSGPLPTVEAAWMLTAALAAQSLGDTSRVMGPAAHRLLAAQGPAGIFPHVLPSRSQGRWRAHVGCFADQVYPVQALARLARATGDAMALRAADRCARRICEVQGNGGQWWWHYDVRDGSVVEGYPVYSVHQHAMAPMALLDLLECGGDDHRPEIQRGLAWLVEHPEVPDDLVDKDLSVVWRKVGRREPPKAVRRLNAVTTSVRPGLRVPGLQRVFPAVKIDRECRPYELGWLLYAWRRRAAAERHTWGLDDAIEHHRA